LLWRRGPILVGQDGRVRDADILRQSFSVYDGLLLKAVKKWRYLPAQKRNHPVEYRWIIDYVLKSSDEASVAR
jgi:hypothetical protein